MKGAAAPPAADAASAARAAEQKARGNECFTSMAYAQAAVYCTEALALDPSLTACLSNRAACWLKLGTPEKAIQDAKAAKIAAAGAAIGSTWKSHEAAIL